jgi:hypothetical protein
MSNTKELWPSTGTYLVVHYDTRRECKDIHAFTNDLSRTAGPPLDRASRWAETHARPGDTVCIYWIETPRARKPSLVRTLVVHETKWVEETV